MNPLLRLTLVLLLSIPAHGVFAQDLYTGMVPVSGQSETERNQVIPDAFIHVLQKLSGRRDLSGLEGLDQALADATQNLIAFQYQEQERLLPDGTVEPVSVLAARFQSEAADRAVRELGLPRWRPERKPVVLWVVVDDGSGRTLMPVEYAYAWSRAEDVAGFRGLPLDWPELSADLAELIDLQLLWGGYTDQLLTADSDSDGVAIVAARREGPEWNVRWTFADADTSSSWRTRSTDLSLAVTDGIHQLTDLVASIHSISPSGLGDWEIDLVVGGLLSGGEYARCMSYLQGLSLVEHVGIVGADSSGVQFRLSLNAEPTYLEELIRGDGVLEPGEEPGRYQLHREPSGR